MNHWTVSKSPSMLEKPQAEYRSPSLTMPLLRAGNSSVSCWRRPILEWSSRRPQLLWRSLTRTVSSEQREILLRSGSGPLLFGCKRPKVSEINTQLPRKGSSTLLLFMCRFFSLSSVPPLPSTNFYNKPSSSPSLFLLVSLQQGQSSLTLLSIG